jgi:glucose-6-phosphate dehydrogenase assembly protein OpcA
MEAAMTPAPSSVKPDRILAELSKLWTASAQQEKGKQAGSGTLRACAMTLIVFVDDEAGAGNGLLVLGETLIRIMRSHPSRVIVVRLSADGATLESRVFQQCWTPFGHRQQICCEQVELTVSLSRLADIPSIVGPLAAPDVPRIVWIRSSRIASAPDLADVLALGDKMIVDSARQGAPASADLRVLSNAGFLVADLAWTRLTKLRQLLARLLDGRDLNGVRSVTIEFSGAEATAEVRYLQAWLRASLASAVVDLRHVDVLAPSMLNAIRIDPGVTVRVTGNCAEYEAGSLKQHAALSESSESDLLSEELNIMTRDGVFERALQRMTAWTPRS